MAKQPPKAHALRVSTRSGTHGFKSAATIQAIYMI
jgi:hypothetical protein